MVPESEAAKMLNKFDTNPDGDKLPGNWNEL